MNLKSFNINLSTFFSLKNKKLSIEKAYTEGVYADTPANRKLGRVGMTYAEWDKKQGKKEEKIDNISVYRLGKVFESVNLHPQNIRDHKDYFLVSLEEDDFKNKEKVNKTKRVLEHLGAKVYISEHTHFLKAFKKDIDLDTYKEQDLYKIGNLKLDIYEKTLTDKNGEKTKLLPREVEVLSVFVSKPNEFISREKLLEEIWGESNYFNSRSLDVYISKIKDKLKKDKDIKLLTLPWKGWKLVLPKRKANTIVTEEDKEKIEKNQIDTLKKINNHFGFEDEEISWFADTPISLTMANDKEFSDIIDKFTNYKVVSKNGSYKNDGSRETMLKCSVEYEIVPKGTLKTEIDSNKRKITIDKKTTIRNLIKDLVV